MKFPLSFCPKNLHLQNELRELRRIRRAVSDHDILNVPVNANCSTIRKAYHRLALSVHPDNVRIRRHLQENPTDEREFSEAFQRVDNAYRNLTANGNGNDSNARRAGNDDGNEGENEGASHCDDDETSCGHNDNDAEDDLRRENTSEFGRGACQNWWETVIGFNIFVSSPAILLILLPLIVSIAYIAVAPLFVANPIFRLKRDSVFVTRNHTEFGKIPYFVRSEPQFKTEFRERYDTFDEFEWDVISAYQHKLQVKCNRENNKDKLLEEARISGNHKTYMEAKSVGTPSCDKLAKIIAWKESNPVRWKKWNLFLKFRKYF